MNSIIYELFGAPSIMPTIPTRGIRKTVFNRSSAPSGSDMILVDCDEGAARDAAFVRSGKFAWRIHGCLERDTKTAANGLMSVGLREGLTEVFMAATAPDFSSSPMHGLEF